MLRRGALAIACNLSAVAASVPVSGEVLLAWDEPHPGDTLELPGHSFAVVRTSAS